MVELNYQDVFMHEVIKKLYQCEPEKALCDGIRPILDDVYYVAFIYDAYGTNDIICMYVGHDGDGVVGRFDEEQNEGDDNDSCVDGVENEVNLRYVEVENDEDAIPMNITAHVSHPAKPETRGVAA
ncbi:unnamed protein product [Lactuca saligna]|uniref:Uncharacterized protein n=1 Tax=Lactuca saligna TaxID=75948 RepID=A0AA35YE03_LACSI|nr:unnamed protein product [Lactuca saligna]